ncbi:MAG TPA: hypothetical protein VFF26_04590 [Gallionella sp.]|nr:hypothetical protein [Gallionella sp.]
MAAAIGQCVALWGSADNEIGIMFSQFLGTDSEATLEVFLILRRSGNQLEALETAAKYKLAGDEVTIFQALKKLYSSLEKERNYLAHGVYGVCDEQRDILFLIPIKDHVTFMADIVPRLTRGDEVADPHFKLKLKMFVWKLAELHELQEQMRDFIWGAMAFNAHLRERGSESTSSQLERARNILLSLGALDE